LGPITKGFDFNFFKKVTVVSGTFTTNCDVIIPFSTYTVTLQLESGGPIEYSFNGNTVHGDMTLTKPSENLVFENRVISKIWFKGTGLVRVEAWAIR
jgi:hypothetical protein